MANDARTPAIGTTPRHVRGLIVAVLASGMIGSAFAGQRMLSDPSVSSLAPPGREVTLIYANRPIVTLRAQVFGRMPAERAEAAVRALDGLIARDVTQPVSTREAGGAMVILVGGEGVITILPADVDVLSEATLDATATAAAARLRIAIAEAVELHAPARLLRGVMWAIVATIVLGLLLWLLWRLDRSAAHWLLVEAERRIARMRGGQAVRAAHAHHVLRHSASLALGAIGIILVYLWVAFVLRRFPYTRPWGESLRSVLLARIGSFGAAILDAVPGLCVVAIIVVAARYASKASGRLFDAVEHRRVSMPGVYPDTAAPTKRLVTALVWLLALAMAYPYIPGSESPGFKGISVFVGLIVSLGSAGVMQHLMSGLMLTYSRAVHVGDFARIGGVEGTVLQIGALATKLRTPCDEEITIPNAVVVSQTTTNYSRGTDEASAFVATSVTIGYDTPWRQVDALLLTAAERTARARRTPAPIVRHAALEDYYVKYTLLVAPEDSCRRVELLDELHARILDAFNEHGVQIMSPHYMADPAAPKVVPPSRWFAPAASPSAARARGDIAHQP